MIISRAPFRVSFCGGGSDIPDFYRRFGGCVLSCAIKKYVYIAIHPSFEPNSITLKYSKTEKVYKFQDIEHKYFKIILTDNNVSGVEITSMADIPAGTGLGSSSSFCVATLNAVNAYKNKFLSKQELAEKACEVEIEKALSPIGKQDQFAAAFGGLNFIYFNKDDSVTVEPIHIPNDGEKKLQQNILMFYTNLQHDANEILVEQSKNTISVQDKIDGQKKLCDIAKELKVHLENGDIDYLGKALKESWEIKKTLSSKISNTTIDKMYDLALDAGATGGKLLGAGGGGFLLFYVKPEHQLKVRKALKDYMELKFEIDHDGATIIYGVE